MDILIVMIILFIVLLPIFIFAFIVMRNSSYKNKAMIARQTGRDINDVIWLEDSYKITNENGNWLLEFKRMKERTQSIDGSVWTKFLAKKYHNKMLKYTRDEWDRIDMRRHIKRGLFFYETTEGELYPMTIQDHSFNIIDRDDRLFVMTETQNVNELVKNDKKMMTTLLAIIIGIVVLGVVFVGGAIWQNNTHEKNIVATQQVGIAYAQSVYNVTCGGYPTYIANINKNLPQGNAGG